MDAHRHAHPRRFDSNRYAGDTTSLADSAASQDMAQRDTFVIGAGRRIYPVMHVAERSLSLRIVRLLWAFDITPAQDDGGRNMLPAPDKLTQGFACMPEECKCVITPRSEVRAEVQRRAWEAAQPNLDPQTKQWIRLPKEMKTAK